MKVKDRRGEEDKKKKDEENVRGRHKKEHKRETIEGQNERGRKSHGGSKSVISRK